MALRACFVFVLGALFAAAAIGVRRGAVAFGPPPAPWDAPCARACGGRRAVRAAIEADATGAVRGFLCECAVR